ncbi:MAG: type II toxin-antitoxin system Phd/YefM family antitoxin [Flavobacterium sp.]
MKVINYSDLRMNLKKWLDSVTDDMEEVLVTRKNNKNLVVISQDEYNALTETNYLLSGKNREVLLKAVEDVKNKETIQKNLIEE